MRNTIFPVYVVIDFSESMARSVDSTDNRTRIDVAKDIIPTLIRSMKADSSVAESLRVRVIGFNNNVIICTELFDYYDLEKWYKEEGGLFAQKCKWQTWYGKAFERLHSCIDEDMDKFVREGKGYYRPLVYFLTDGKPEGENDNERESKYKALVNNADSHRNPVILCVGIGPEDMSILKRYGASRYKTPNGEYRTNNKEMTFIIKTGVKTGDGLARLNESVIKTIRYSLQQRMGAEKEIDPSVFEDEGEKLKEFFERDRLS